MGTEMINSIEKNIIKGGNFRITVLTDRLIRLEYSQEEKFVDGQTRAVVCRDFPEVYFDAESGNGL